MKANIQGVQPIARDKTAAAQNKASVGAASRKVRLLQGTSVLLTLLILASVIQRQRAAVLARSEEETCYANLKQISADLMKYRQEHNGRLPKILRAFPGPLYKESEMLYPNSIKSPDILVCPGYVRFQREQGAPGANRKPMQTYNYVVQYWLRDFPGDTLRSAEFYNQIVPQKRDRIRLVQCNRHPGRGVVRAVMWDGSLQEQSALFDHYFGQGRRDPQVRKLDERIRKQGGILLPEG